MKHRLTILMAMLLSVIFVYSASASDGDRILGVYKAVGETSGIYSKVKFYKHDDNKYYGKVVWVEHPDDAEGRPLLDTLNPDPELRSVPVNEIVIIRELTYNPDEEEWADGTAYNPATGKTYDVIVSLETPEKLKVRGYIGKPMFGKNYYWDKLE